MFLHQRINQSVDQSSVSFWWVLSCLLVCLTACQCVPNHPFVCLFVWLFVCLFDIHKNPYKLFPTVFHSVYSQKNRTAKHDIISLQHVSLMAHSWQKWKKYILYMSLRYRFPFPILFFTVNSPSITKRSVSQENASKQSKHLSPFFTKL